MTRNDKNMESNAETFAGFSHHLAPAGF